MSNQKAETDKKPLELPEGTTLLFQGDSITDAGRDRGQYYANNGNGLGKGYAYQISSHLLGEHPKKKLRIYNRGISGHKVFQLANRWEDDCLQLKPDILSILIGVNDFWHALNGRYDGTVDVYDTDLRKLLERTKSKKSLSNNVGVTFWLCAFFLFYFIGCNRRHTDVSPNSDAYFANKWSCYLKLFLLGVWISPDFIV